MIAARCSTTPRPVSIGFPERDPAQYPTAWPSSVGERAAVGSGIFRKLVRRHSPNADYPPPRAAQRISGPGNGEALEVRRYGITLRIERECEVGDDPFRFFSADSNALQSRGKIRT